MKIHVDDLDDLYLGSQLGVVSATMTVPGALEAGLRALLHRNGPVEVLSAAEAMGRFPAENWAAVLGGVGSLAAMEELPPTLEEPVRALRALEKVVGREFRAVAPLNSAGPSLIIALAAASHSGLPLLDLDGQGQVLPLIDQTTYRLEGLSPSPLAGAGPWGDVITLDCAPQRAETLARAAVTGAGGWLATALYPATLAELVSAGIPDAVSRTMQTGRLMRDNEEQLAVRIAAHLGGKRVGRGRVQAISAYRSSTTPRKQPARPMSLIIDCDVPRRSEIRIELLNEAVLLLVDGGVAAAAPDIICLLDPVQHGPIDVLELRAGDLVEVLVIPSHRRWQTAEGVALAGPRSFGLPIDYPGGVP